MTDSEMQGIKPGDTALIRAEVLKVQPGVGLLVELLSKTEAYKAWIRTDLIADVELCGAGLDPEPEDGRWVKSGPLCAPRLWYRDDAEGHCDPERRFDRHWWSYLSQSWVDWPEVNAEMAQEHGADYSWELIELYVVKAD